MSIRSWACLGAVVIWLSSGAWAQEKSGLATIQKIGVKKSSLDAAEKQKLDGAVKEVIDGIGTAKTTSAVHEAVGGLDRIVRAARGADFRRSFIQAIDKHANQILLDAKQGSGEMGIYRATRIVMLVAGMQEPEAIPMLTKAREHAVPSVRLWGAKGLADLILANSKAPPIIARAAEPLANIGPDGESSSVILRAIYQGLNVKGEPVTARKLLAVLDGRLKLYAEGRAGDKSPEETALDVAKATIPAMPNLHADFMKNLVPLMRYVTDEYVAAYAAYEEWKTANVPDPDTTENQRRFSNPFKVKSDDLTSVNARAVQVDRLNRIVVRIRSAVLVLESLVQATVAISLPADSKQLKALLAAPRSGDPQAVAEIVTYWIGNGGVWIKKYKLPVPQPAQIVEKKVAAPAEAQPVAETKAPATQPATQPASQPGK